MLNLQSNLSVAALLTLIMAPVGFSQTVNVTTGAGATNVRVNASAMPVQPDISPELAAAIKATMPMSGTMPPAMPPRVSVVVSASTAANTMAKGMAELDHATSDEAMGTTAAQMDAATHEPANVQVDMTSPMAPKVNVATPSANVRVDARQAGNADVKVTTSAPQQPAAPLAVDAKTFAKLQAMIPSAQGVISGSDMLVQAPTFILRVPVSRTEALTELYLTPEDTTNMPANVNVDVQTSPPAAE